MTQQPLDFSSPRRRSINDRMADYFQMFPNQWLDVANLASIGGLGGWRSRLAELRFPPFSMPIENRQGRWPDGRRRSQYRFTPRRPA
jgi:hypothetical protein